mmetsp:Transcript_614/g.1916  ORF Transcript_614/g.1916 Transcript_614/m.1916 type:complete len:325 (+) Transcript_614:1180-2154(+)
MSPPPPPIPARNMLDPWTTAFVGRRATSAAMVKAPDGAREYLTWAVAASSSGSRSKLASTWTVSCACEALRGPRRRRWPPCWSGTPARRQGSKSCGARQPWSLSVGGRQKWRAMGAASRLPEEPAPLSLSTRPVVPSTWTAVCPACRTTAPAPVPTFSSRPAAAALGAACPRARPTGGGRVECPRQATKNCSQATSRPSKEKVRVRMKSQQGGPSSETGSSGGRERMAASWACRREGRQSRRPSSATSSGRSTTTSWTWLTLPPPAPPPSLCTMGAPGPAATWSPLPWTAQAITTPSRPRKSQQASTRTSLAEAAAYARSGRWT